MSDEVRKQKLLSSWLAGHMPTNSTLILQCKDKYDPIVAISKLKQCPQDPSIYILFAGSEGLACPVYIGKAENPVARWKQHFAGWAKGAGSYSHWRTKLLDAENRALADLTLLIVPIRTITRPLLDGFPITMGSLEYQLIGLTETVHPGRLFNSEGKSR